MEERIYNVKLFLYDEPEFDKDIEFFQNDTKTCILNINLYKDRRNPYIVNGNVSIQINKNDGTIVLDNLTKVDEGEYTYEFPNNSINVVGNHIVTIQCNGIDNDRITFKSFKYKIKAEPKNGDISSQTEYPILTRLIADNNNLKEEVTVKENIRATNEEIRKANETTRKANETVRENNFNKAMQEYGAYKNVMIAESNVAALQNQINTTNSQLEQKVNYNYVDTKIGNIVNSTPKGVYQNLSELNRLKPSGETGIYITSDNGNWNYWNGTVWVAGGVYQASNIQKSSIGVWETKYPMALGVKSKNIFTEWELGFINKTTGIKENSNTTIRTKYPIEVTPSATITISDPEGINANASNVQHMFEYDANKTLIGLTIIYIDSNNIKTIKLKDNTRFIDFLSQSVFPNGTYKIGNYDNFKTQVEVGESFTGYESPIPKPFVEKGYIQAKSVGIKEDAYIKASGTPSSNIFDGEVEYGFLNYTTGIREPHNNIIINKNIIKVDKGSKVSFKLFGGKIYDISMIFEYDLNKKFIKYTGVSKTEGIIALSEQTEYINFRSQTNGVNGYVLPSLDYYAKNLVIQNNDKPILKFIDGTPKVSSKDIMEKAILKEHLGFEINNSENGFKEYYKNELERVISKVENDITNSKCSVFGFITDQQGNTFIENTSNALENYKNINYISDFLPIQFIANTGDFIMGDSPKNISIEELKKYSKITFENAKVPYMIARGNHDDNSGYTMNNGRLYNDLITELDWYKYVVKYAERFPQFVWNDEDREGGYCYLDDNNSKIRYIWLNIFNTPSIKNTDGTYKYDAMNVPALRDKQLQWLSHKALNFKDKKNTSEWATVIFTHYVHTAVKNFSLLRSILGAYITGTAYSGESTLEDFESTINVDFTSQGKGEFITFICGDTHKDRGFEQIRFTGGEYSQAPLYQLTRASSMITNGREPFTENQDRFDIMVIDRNVKEIRTTRFGEGEDAIFNYGNYEPKYQP